MELRHLQYFTTVAETLNFSRAAERLNVAQPAISKQMADLEREIGAPLFTRSKRGVKLTAAGQSLVIDAHKILSAVDTARDNALQASRGQIGKLSVGFFGAPTIKFLPELIARYREAYPQVNLELHEINPSAQLTAFERGQIDIGFNRPLSPMDATRFNCLPVLKEKIKLAMPAKYFLNTYKRVPLKALLDQNVILLERSQAPGLFDSITGSCLNSGVSLKIIATPALMSTVMTMVASGLGVSIVPEGVKNLMIPGVIFADLLPGLPDISLELQWLKSNQSPAVKSFVEMIKKFDCS